MAITSSSDWALNTARWDVIDRGEIMYNEYYEKYPLLIHNQPERSKREDLIYKNAIKKLAKIKTIPLSDDKSTNEVCYIYQDAVL